MITIKRLAEIVAMPEGEVDTSDIPEADAAWFEGATLIPPGGDSRESREADDDRR